MPEIEQHLVERMMQRFDGSKRCHGRFIIGALNTSKNKMEGEAKTIHETPTEETWISHLKGEIGIGVVPIDASNKCKWGVIDIDTYPIDFDAIQKSIDKLQLPLVICRTKSGGAHLFLFTKEKVSATLLREKLESFRISLGYSADTEIFPKQTGINKNTAFGNWLNMPYFNSEDTDRYCIQDTRKLSLSEFLDTAEQKSVDKDYLITPVKSVDTFFEGAPPCIVTLSNQGGFQEGSRNNALFDIGVFLKKKYPDSWEGKLDEANQKYFEVPLPSKEIASTILRTLRSKDPFYKCNDTPIKAVCDKKACKNCPFGLGGQSDPGVGLSDLRKVLSVPPIWLLKVNNSKKDLELYNTEDLLQFNKFQTRCVEQLNVSPHRMKQEFWDREVRTLLDNVKEIDAPDELSPKGELLVLLQDYCITKASKASCKDDVLIGKVYDEGEAYFFKSDYFKDFIKTKRFPIKPNELWQHLSSEGVISDKRRLNSRTVKHVWIVPKKVFENMTYEEFRDQDEILEEIYDDF